MSKTNSLKRLTMLGAMMAAMMAALPTMGQTNYVIMYNSYILGQTAGETTDFIPNASIYTGTSGSTFRNGNGYYIVYAGNNTNVNFSTTEGSNLTISNNHLYYNNYYLRYSGSNHVFQFRNQYNVEANVYEVTTSSHINDFSISGDATIATMGTNSSYSHTNATYYDIYSFNNLTYYSTNPSVAASTTAPTSGLPTLTTGYTWSISANSYATVNTTTGAITVNSLPATDQNVTLTCSATRNGVTQTATKTITLEAPKVDPTGISITSGNTMTAYVGNTSNITYSLTPSPCYNNVTFSSANTGIASVNGSGVVTGVATGTTTITVTALKIDGTTTSALTKTVNVTVKDKVATPVIAFTPTVADAGATATAEITCSTTGTAIYYTVNGSDPTSSSTQYNGTFTVNDGDIVKAIAIKTTDATYWDNSDIASRTYTACSTTAPVITYAQSGSSATVTITAETGATIYYTTNGNNPTASSTSGTTTVTIPGVASGATVKAFAKNGNCQASSIVSKEIITSGVSGGVVTLYDYEDHNWSYYQASGNLPTGYPTEYLSSPDPRNVKITYRGGSVNNASAVAISALDDEGQNTMVYYKTLEKSVPGMTGDYPYTVISNPFSKRPATGSGNSKVYYGFAGWKVISGGEYISEYADNATLPLDATIHFTNLNTNYTPNCTSAEVVFEATWTEATVKTGNSAQTFTGGTYETNFWVLSGNNNIGNITVTANATTSARYPDGTVNFTRNLTGTITAGGDNAKVEFVNMASTGAVSAANHTFTMGRGIVNTSNGGDLRGCTSNSNCVQTVKIESGTYATLHNFTTDLNAARTCDQLMILGCDYDRAKNDNTKMIVRGDMYVGSSLQLNRSANSLYIRTYIKSGNFGSTVNVNNNYTGAGGSQTYYYSVSGTHNAGRRFLCVEGGRLMGIAGGMDETNNQTVTARGFDLRVRGTAQVDGVVYGAAEFAGARGTRTMVFTGGTIKGWIAGGANGTRSDGGALNGASYIYFGGTAEVNSENSNLVLNRAVGGNVFGAGCGYSNTSSSGQILNYNTNVVVADESYVERGVYGGGSYGYTTQTSNIYILGGTIDGKDGGANGTSYSAAIDGGVYGGACQNQGGTVNIIMNGGTVNGSVYGGSNYTGTLSGTSTVTLNGGTINGSLYGGGNGEGSTNTNVTGAVAVRVNGGSVTGAVYGCNNNAGAPQSTVTVDIYGTDPAPAADAYAIGQVFGGGNQASYTYGTPVVTVHNCDNSIEYVYGGGNAATVPGTNVTIEGGNKIGNVFGGCYGANVTTNGTKVNVKGGTIGKVFGGNNQSGTITGAIKVRVDKQSTCPMKIGELYGGGNVAASAVGSIDIGCTGDLTAAHATCNETDNRIGYELEGIGDVYGGANAAAVTGNVNLTIDSGMVYRVFGNNNTSASVSGTITVNIDKKDDACGWYVGYVYGGGNQAPYTAPNATPNYPAVNVKNGMVSHNVFGGGLGGSATVTGNPQVILSGTAEVGGNVYGGGNAAPVSGNTKVTLRD